jgi:hypothetical protein
VRLDRAQQDALAVLARDAREAPAPAAALHLHTRTLGVLCRLGLVRSKIEERDVTYRARTRGVTETRTRREDVLVYQITSAGLSLAPRTDPGPGGWSPCEAPTQDYVPPPQDD